MKWASDLGLWRLLETERFSICGSTPRHADVWSVNVEVGEYEFCVAVEYRLVYVSVAFGRIDGGHEIMFGRHRMHRKFGSIYSLMCPCQNRSSRRAGREKS